WWRHEFELGSVHEDGAVKRIVQLIQERSGGTLNPMVFRDDVQEILHAQDIAAQNRRLDLPDSERLSPPGLGRAGGDVVASDAGELLGEHLGLPIGQVGVLGHNGRLGHHNPGAESFAVDPGTNRDVPVRDEHTRNFLLLFGRDRRLWRNKISIWSVDVNLIHDFKALLRLLSWEGGAIQEGLHPVIHTAILAFKGGAKGPERNPSRLDEGEQALIHDRLEDFTPIYLISYLPLGQFKFKLVLLEHRFVAHVLHLLLALLGAPDPQHARHPAGQEAHGRDTRDLGHLHFHAAGHFLAAGIHAAVLFEVQPERLDPLKDHHGFVCLCVCVCIKLQKRKEIATKCNASPDSREAPF
ncbi:hypothetical protein E2320_013742, partial [Naja naja]